MPCHFEDSGSQKLLGAVNLAAILARHVGQSADQELLLNDTAHVWHFRVERGSCFVWFGKWLLPTTVEDFVMTVMLTLMIMPPVSIARVNYRHCCTLSGRQTTD